jgi:hypothetical protein
MSLEDIMLSENSHRRQTLYGFHLKKKKKLSKVAKFIETQSRMMVARGLGKRAIGS